MDLYATNHVDTNHVDHPTSRVDLLMNRLHLRDLSCSSSFSETVLEQCQKSDLSENKQEKGREKGREKKENEENERKEKMNEKKMTACENCEN